MAPMPSEADRLMAQRVDILKRRIDSMLDVINDLTASNTDMRTFISDMGFTEAYAAWSAQPTAGTG